MVITKAHYLVDFGLSGLLDSVLASPQVHSTFDKQAVTDIYTREGVLGKNIVAVSFLLKLCYIPILLIHIFSIH